MSAALLDLATVKTLLGITGTAEDAKLTAAMPVITEYFENHCKRGLAFVTGVIEEMAVTPRLALFRFPIDGVTELLVDGVVDVPLRVDTARGFVHMGWRGEQVARVTYDGGYPQDEVPADLAEAYARACADYGGVSYTASSTSGSGGAPLKSLGLGSGALTVSFDTAAAAQSAYDTSAVPPVLAPYLFALEHYRVKDYV